MFGWALNSLRHRLEDEEEEWRTQNRIRGELRLNPLQNSVLKLAASPVLFVLSLFVVVTAATLFTGIVDSERWVIIHVAELRIPDPIAYFAALWSVQAAIAALVYPIVIAFVTLLLGRSSSVKATLHIYLHDSAALLAGLSALILVAEMGVQYLGVPYVTKTTINAWLAFDAAWFVVNIWLTTYFLFRTFEFVQPGRRFEIVRKYAVSVAWPREARFHLGRHFFLAAVEENHLPGPKYGSAKGREPSVLPGYIGMTMGVAAVTCSHRHRRQLCDIYFRPLRWATRSWLARAKKAKPKSQPDQAVSGWKTEPVISFPVDPFESYEGTTTLCNVQGDIPLNFYERFLIGLSFDFGSSGDLKPQISVNDILQDIQKDAIAALNSGELDLFEDVVKRMLNIHESIIKASRVRDAAGGEASLALVADRNHWFGAPVFQVWSRRFVDLFDVACGKLSLGEDYVRILTHVPNRLFSAAEDSGISDILKHSILLNTILLKRIEAWWVRTVEQQGVIDHGPCKPEILRPPYHGLHDRVIREFVGAWESLKNERIPLDRDDKATWKDVKEAAQYFEVHLSHTIVLLFDAILRGDRNTAEWLTDVLIKWYGELDYKFQGVHHYFMHKQRLNTFELLGLGEAEIEERIQFEAWVVPNTPKPLAVLAVCLHNLWVDTCCIAIYQLSLWGAACDCAKSLPADLLAAIVRGKALRHGGHALGGDAPYSSADELLFAILRQYFGDGSYRTGYRDRLDRYVERIAELSKSEWVSGRVYSSVGADDLDSLRDGQLIALLLCISGGWRAGVDIKELLSDWSRSQNEKLREFERMLQGWKARLAEESFATTRNTYECLQGKLSRDITFETAIATLTQGIDDLIEHAGRVHEIALADAPVSDLRLLEIGKWASEQGFAKESAGFPIPLFGEIVLVDGEIGKRTLVINGMKKGEFTEHLMAQRAANEKTWIAETMRRHIAAVVQSEMLSELKPESVDAESPEAYWARVKRYASDARAKGLHPILLLENPTIPSWVWDWAHARFQESSTGVPADLVVERDRAQLIEGYQQNFNGIPVFAAPVPSGASYLVSQESFEKIEFLRHSDGRYVTASVRPVAQRPTNLDLVLSWQMRISVKRHPAIRLVYSEHGNREVRRKTS